ncbi:MAG: hypothetical protein ACQEUO_07350 [Bacillota bacterium]
MKYVLASVTIFGFLSWLGFFSPSIIEAVILYVSITSALLVGGIAKKEAE